MAVVYLFGAIILAMILSYQVMHALSRVQQRSYRLFRLFLFPGVVIHELAHATACWLTGTPIESISFWTATGGHVIHHKPKWPILIQPLISFAPFPVGIALLLLLSQLVPHGPWYVSILAILLMLSISATLAPSKADIMPTIESLALFVIIIGALIYFAPEIVFRLTPWIDTTRNQILIVDTILAIFWVILLIVRQTQVSLHS